MAQRIFSGIQSSNHRKFSSEMFQASLPRTENAIKQNIKNRRKVDEVSKSIQSFEKIPGPGVHPIVGSMPSFLPFGNLDLKKRTEFGFKLLDRYGDVVRLKLPSLPNYSLYLFDPNDYDLIYGADGKYPRRQSDFGILLGKYLQTNEIPIGIVSEEGATWWKMRRAINKKLVLPHVARESIKEQKNIAECLVERIKLIRDPVTLEVSPNFSEELLQYTLEMIGIPIFGQKLQDLDKQNQNKRAIQFIRNVVSNSGSTSVLTNFNP